MALKIDLRPGDVLMIGDVTLKMVKKSGQLACIVIDADKSVPIRRVTAEPEQRSGLVIVPA